MTLPFLTFPKISASARSGGARGDWVASEKIHGAQLVLGANADEVRIGKRKAWLGQDEPFFGHQMLRPTLHEAARTVLRALGDGGAVWIYGELFGGHYPHPEVARVMGLGPVQTGIWYAPGLQYAVFDIVCQRGSEEPVFLAHDRVQELATAAGLLVAPVLGRGRLSDLMQLPVRYPARVPQLLGLPSLPSNDAEGYVLKPAGQLPVLGRPCIKQKIPEFDEQRFDESVSFDPNAHLSREALFSLAE